MLTNRLAAAVSLVLVWSTSLSASAIIIFRRPGSVVIAADSMRVASVGAPQLGCKIRQSGRWVFSVAGLDVAYSTTGAVLVDLNDVVAQAIATAPTLIAALTAVDTATEPFVRTIIEAYRGKPGFSALFHVDGPITQVVVADAAQIGIWMPMLVSADPVRLTHKAFTCPGELCPDGSLSYGASAAPEVWQLKVPLAPWVARGDGPAARRIVRELVAALPGKIGGPIDVLEIAAVGARWVDRDPASLCAALPQK